MRPGLLVGVVVGADESAVAFFQDVRDNVPANAD